MRRERWHWLALSVVAALACSCALPRGGASAESAADGAVLARGPMRIGTTFSRTQCGYLGLDWRETYRAILSLDLDVVRLGAEWDEIEAQPGRYDFEKLDWQIAQARRRGVPVLLAVGMKTPRWPEYHLPLWLLKQVRLRHGRPVGRQAPVREGVLRFIREVVERYRDEPAVRWWQVENEPYDRAGPGQWWIEPELVEKEVALVRELDPQHRLTVLNFATYPHGLLRRLVWFFTRHDPVGEGLASADILALNVYPVVGHRWGRLTRSYYWTSPDERAAHLVPIVRRIQEAKRPVWVTELQAEPWEPGWLAYTGAAHPPTSHPEMLQPYVEEMRELGIEVILLWGAEYWYFRKTRLNDSTWWDAVRALLEETPADAGGAT
ncbi:MAG TPA: beta-galactosidase [bacterium]